MSTAVITSPTCRFKTTRNPAALHKPIIRADICGDCLAAMQASLTGAGPAFCHECGYHPAAGDLMGYFYRDSGALWLCGGCSARYGAALTSEVDAAAADRQALIINSATANHEIITAPTAEQRMNLWYKWRQIVGPRRRV